MSALVRDVHAGHLREGLGEVEFEHVLITLTGPKTFFFFSKTYFLKKGKRERDPEEDRDPLRHFRLPPGIKHPTDLSSLPGGEWVAWTPPSLKALPPLGHLGCHLGEGELEWNRLQYGVCGSVWGHRLGAVGPIVSLGTNPHHRQA